MQCYSFPQLNFTLCDFSTILFQEIVSMIFFNLFFGHTVWHVGSWVPDQGSKPASPTLEGGRNPWTAGLLFLLFF